MNRDLDHYIKVYKGLISNTLRESTLKQLQDAQFKKHEFYDAYTDKYAPTKNDLSVSWDTIQSNNALMQVVYIALREYVKVDCNFNWWPGWNGFTDIRFNKYDEHTEMKEHWDNITDMFDGTRKGVPTLSVVGLLNDNFTGGEFIMWEDNVVPLEAGDVVVFPSNFLYPHRVNQITQGTRYSFVSWSW